MSHQILSKDTMFSVREMPWHGLGAVLEDYPTSIEDALEKSGLGWRVRQGSILVPDGEGDPITALRVAQRIAAAYEAGEEVAPAEFERLLAATRGGVDLSLAENFRANRREDDGSVLGVVSEEYKVVQNEEAFRFMDALIGSELHFETAGSLLNGRKVWVLARIPEFVEVGGDETATFIYVANSHDGSMAVTASVTPIRIVCANTLGAALRRSESGANAQRTYRFRHTGDLAVKFDEARRVMGIAVNYAKRFKEMGDKLALEKMPTDKMVKVTEQLIPIDPETQGARAQANRLQSQVAIMRTFLQGGPSGDTRGNAPGTKWCAWNAVAEFADWGRRYTSKTDQMGRSFEDSGETAQLKQRGLELILAA